MKRCLVIFAKEPQKGKVKTRLKECFSDSRLLNLYKAFVKDTLSIAKKVRCEEKILAFYSTKRPLYLKRIARPFKFYKQKGKNLGERMHNAFVRARKNKADRTVIIGSDSPTLLPEVIQKAFQKLNRNDVVLGPAADGGYYLIGLKEPCSGLFKGVKWSSTGVLSDTLKQARRLGKSSALLAEWHDVDDPQSLEYLARYLAKEKNKGTAFWTRKFYEK